MIKSPTVFVPAHITAFFDPHYDRDPMRSGSRGAGFSITLGAKVRLDIKKSKSQNIDVFINGKKSNAITTKTAIRNIVGNSMLDIKVYIKQDLPSSQGFGMSGAGALGASLALAEVLGLDRITAIKSAHQAEIMCRTGLGDVISQSFGGIEIRKSPGLPPWGMIEHIPGDFEVVLCVLGRKLRTSDILSDKKLMENISFRGKYALSSLLENPSVENLFTLSYEFMNFTGLANDTIKKAINVANMYGRSSMCMIGNSIFAVGKTDIFKEVLSNFGKVYVARVDHEGARILD